MHFAYEKNTLSIVIFAVMQDGRSCEMTVTVIDRCEHKSALTRNVRAMTNICLMRFGQVVKLSNHEI